MGFTSWPATIRPAAGAYPHPHCVVAREDALRLRGSKNSGLKSSVLLTRAASRSKSSKVISSWRKGVRYSGLKSSVLLARAASSSASLRETSSWRWLGTPPLVLSLETNTDYYWCLHMKFQTQQLIHLPRSSSQWILPSEDSSCSLNIISEKFYHKCIIDGRICIASLLLMMKLFC